MGELEIAQAHAALAGRQLARAEHGAALESLATALRLAPGVAALWAQFSDLIRYFNLRHPVPPPVRALLAAALEHPAVDPANLVRPVSTLALSRGPGAALDEPLLLRLLEDALIRDPALERAIVDARRAMLERVLDAPAPLDRAVAIAHQCFNTEYVFEESAAEREQLAHLERAIASSGAAPPHWCAVYAAYRPLSALKRAPTAPQSLVRRQIAEPLEEAQLRKDMALGEMSNGVSAAVRAQYEANPYPRWVRTQLEGFEEPAHAIPAQPRILVAGCGTGQNAITTARRFAGSRVLALDLSLASLGYAARKTRELGLAGRIEYRHADLLAFGTGAGERFDLVECSGVLHHLDDPLAGWRALAGTLKPRGLMRVGLYSAAGRRDVARARALIAAEGFAADAAGIRACRAAIRARPHDELLARLARNEDFFSMSGCRDLLFHVHEVCFTLPQVADMIQALGLEFLGFELADSGTTLERYQARFPGDAAAADLGNWHRLEQEFPDSFTRPYQFWVRAAA